MSGLGSLPVHGFVLAGGRSSRMGRDKALLEIGGKPMVQIAVEKLRSFCAEVSIVGEREDLAGFAPVIRGERQGLGPAAGIEAGLQASGEPWALFMPVDVPLVPSKLLRRWVAGAVGSGTAGGGEYLVAAGRPQPAFCLLSSSVAEVWHQGVSTGERRLENLLRGAGAMARSVEGIPWFAAAAQEADLWFRNVNTPDAFGAVERAYTEGE